MLLGEFMSTYDDACYNDLIVIENFFSGSLEDFMKTEGYEIFIKRTIKRWCVIGGGAYPVEICVELLEEE